MGIAVRACISAASAVMKTARKPHVANRQGGADDEITKRPVREVISGQRARDGAILAKVSAEAKAIGVEIVDVRLKRVDYVEQINNSVYERMKSERVRVANELRSTGSADSEKIRADADKQRTVILAEAYREAEKIRGEGDAKASQIYAEAFGKNPEFYKFYRSLEAYRATFKDKVAVIVGDPSSNSSVFKVTAGARPKVGITTRQRPQYRGSRVSGHAAPFFCARQAVAEG